MKYEKKAEGFFRADGKEFVQMTNFTAEVIQQTRVHDGKETDTTLTIIGEMKGEKLPEIQVPAAAFQSMAWIATHWGFEPIVMPIGNVERDLKTAIQMHSEPKSIDVYKHTGWTKIGKLDTYLHTGGGITSKGNNPNIRVQLPPDLAKYTFEPNPDEFGNSFKKSMMLSTIGPPETIWPLIIAAFRAAIGPADFALHLSGRTGTFKTEICALIQCHFGEGMDSRNIPGSWSSTANALEALSFNAKEAIFVVDDFVPNGTSWQVRALQKTADQLIRAAGNQAGRARLTDRIDFSRTNYPRGIILSTGEDVPDGHSIRARMMITELSPGDISAEKLTIAQADRWHYQNAIAGWIQWLADDLPGKRERLVRDANAVRDTNRDLGHSRTPGMAGNMLATLSLMMSYANDMNILSNEQRTKLFGIAQRAVMQSAKNQTRFLEEADPADAFIETIQQLLASHLGHVKAKDGSVPGSPGLLGWTESGNTMELKTYKNHGPQIGWTNHANDEMYVDINALAFLKRHAAGKLSMTKQTLLKRLKDGGHLMRTDEARQRNTIRVTLQGHPRHVICICLSKVLQQDGETDD